MLILHFERELPETTIAPNTLGAVAHSLILLKADFKTVSSLEELSKSAWFNQFCQAMNEGTSSAAGFLGHTTMRTVFVESLNEEQALALAKRHLPWSNNPQEGEAHRKTFATALESFRQTTGQISTIYFFIAPK